MKYTPKYQATKLELANHRRKCRNIACGGYIEKHQEGFRLGYCTEWCKEMQSARERKGMKNPHILKRFEVAVKKKEGIIEKEKIKVELALFQGDEEGYKFPHRYLPLVLIVN